MCALASESSVHLFLECNFAQQIWNWLRSILNINFNLTSFFDPLKAIDRNWSPQCKVVILAAIISCYNTIWFCRNQKRYQDKIINIRTAKNLIISSTNMAELIGAMLVIEIAHRMNWWYLWLETDSMEGNKCANILANIGLPTASHVWFSQPPDNIREDLDGLDDDSFENYKSGLMGKLLEKDPSLTYESNRLWNQIPTNLESARDGRHSSKSSYRIEDHGATSRRDA
ncbi:hypothetical protein MTR_7g057410 [Medicago truncatula]|uniref:Uncharacterized protein n=1 Tax=Medicago truncatula TaxID=3880 RepID=A0A072U0V3_MEDTR|nr:hypothetical protein MTR_7g057410 [Medicago truncatula]